MQSINQLIEKSENARRAFTLIEMLIVIGIISILVGASLVSFGKMMKSAEKAKAQELVSEVVTALTGLYEKDGIWPKKIREVNASDNGRLDKDIALILANKGYLSLSVANGKLAGKDRFGVITPWAAKVVDRKGASADLATPVDGNSKVDDHILRFAVDLDGDGVITSTECGNRTGETAIRATAAVWCVSKDGKSTVQSWTKGQAQAVK